MFSWRLLKALYSPNSYALVLLLIVVTYALSAGLTASWATSLIVAVQIAAVWVTSPASPRSSAWPSTTSSTPTAS